MKTEKTGREQSPPSKPINNADGTIDALVLQPARVTGRYTFLDLAVPKVSLQANGFGKWVMARCSRDQASSPRTDWSVYLRRPLFMTGARPIPDLPDTTAITLLVPATHDPGYRWLRDLNRGQHLNLLGPYGRDFVLPQQARQLLLVSSAGQTPLMIPAAEHMLDRNGRVTLIVRDDSVDRDLLTLLPLSIEIQTIGDRSQWMSHMQDGIAWADVMVICDHSLSPQAWADTIRQGRMLLDDDYAQILMSSDLLCCTGACMACVVQRSDGSLTRACIHGPVFPLTALVR